MKKAYGSWTYLISILLSITISGCILRCWNINQSLWWDEIWSTMTYVRANSLWDVVGSIGYYFNNHILYSLLARMSVKAFGESEVSVRLPALIMGLLGIIFLFQFARKFLGTHCAIIAAFLLTISAFHIDHSSEARGYSALALFSILSSYYFLKALKINRLRCWVLYALTTVFGFYSHVFMLAVSLSQLFLVILFITGQKWFLWKTEIEQKALRNFFLSIFFAAITTLLFYSPVIAAFLKNMGKVKIVDVNRMPFVLSLLDTIAPGIKHISGTIVYTLIFSLGMYAVLKKDVILFSYIIIIAFVPIFLYLFINPMFVFKRYFIFALPFILLGLSQGIVFVAEKCKGVYKLVCCALLLFILIYFQLPAIGKVLNQDRQNYREAVRYIEKTAGTHSNDFIFSIGYAGEYFKYYLPNGGIYIPETFNDFKKIIDSKNARIWCLITAWLPDIRPSYENKDLYAEKPAHRQIYKYVKKNFTLIKHFPSKYPVDIYCLEGQKK